LIREKNKTKRPEKVLDFSTPKIYLATLAYLFLFCGQSNGSAPITIVLALPLYFGMGVTLPIIHTVDCVICPHKSPDDAMWSLESGP